MTTAREHALAAPSAPAGRTFNWPKTIAITGVVGAATVFLLATSRRGAEGDARRVNPDPAGTYTVNGVPRGEPALFGFQYWPEFFGLLMLVVAIAVMAPFVISSIRQRKLSHALVVFLATAILAWLDPLANWVTYTVYNPQLLHFPTTWPWFELSPTVEPLLVIPGYPFYYFSIALIAFGGYNRFVLPRVSPNSWWRRHPRVGAFIAGFAVGTLWDVPTELFMINARMYSYSQYWGPTLSIGGPHVALPLIWSLFTIVSIASITVLLYRDDSGESVLTTVGRRLPRFGRHADLTREDVSSDRKVLAGALILSVIYVGLCLFYGTLRVSGISDHPMPVPWVYQEVKTYDPHGDLEKAGFPGPFYQSCCK